MQLWKLAIRIEKRVAQMFIQFEASTIFCPMIFLQRIVYNLISNSLKYSRPAFESEINITTYDEGT